MGEISVKTGNNARNGGKNSLNRLIRCVCGKKIGPDPRNFNQRVSLGRNDLLIRTFPGEMAGARLVREWDPKTGQTRTWYETLDHAGNIRSVAPKPVTNDKNHHIYDADGNYQGRR
ncbi:hypothetical protein [Enterobacter asburiae]|uniref:Uncharacterized protein n=1 Tax=Enterobacter asburiae TaxID=61645 RepID=A0AAW7ZVJ8_ENTAS|nr:hypothetical protein [Enterobacter asburiae]MDO7922257.1 hypothetical protein [Enterobacter asburiae]